MKKSLLITLDFSPAIGGVALYYSNLCDALNPADICVLTPHRTGDQEFDSQRKYKIFRENLIYQWFWPRWLKTYSLANNSLKSSGAEIILVGQVLPVGYIAYMLKKRQGTPYVVFCHGMDIAMQNISKRKKHWRKKILQFADHVIANSEFTRMEMQKLGISENKIMIINPCPATKTDIDPNKLAKLRRQYNLVNKKILLYVGRLTERKGIDIVINSLPEVIKHEPDLIYLIVGDGQKMADLQKLVSEKNLTSHVIFAGAQDIKSVAYFFSLANAFIMITRPSTVGDLESFGMVYLEAGMFGLPVIASNFGGVKETVVNNQTGILLDDISEHAVAQAIIKLFSNPDLMNKFGIQGKRRVDEMFSWKKQADKLQKILSTSRLRSPKSKS